MSPLRLTDNVAAASQRTIALAVQNAPRCVMNCYQRGRTGRADRKQRTLRIEKIAYTSRGRPAMNRRDWRLTGDRVIGFLDPKKDSMLGSTPGLRVVSGIFDRRPRTFQQQAMTRVHRLALARRNAEKQRI